MGAADLGEAVIAEEPVVGRPTNHQTQPTRQEMPTPTRTRDHAMPLQRVQTTNCAKYIINGVKIVLIVLPHGNAP